MVRSYVAGALVRIAQKPLFRALSAAIILTIHLAALTHMSRTRFGQPFNNAPGQPPTMVDPGNDHVARHWNRLAVSRWDAGQYIGLVLEGYKRCPTRDLRKEPLVPIVSTCNLVFYPGYAAVGWVASLGAKLPVDYALLVVSLVASFIALYLWTGPTMVRALGVGGAWLSLLLFSTHTTGFSVVTVQTEPLTFLFTIGAFIALERRKLFLAAVLAGAASGIRVSGACTSAGFAIALAVDTLRTRPPRREWIKRAFLCVLSGWGFLVIATFFYIRFREPMIYARAHAEAFGHAPQLWHVFAPRPEWVINSMNGGVHDVLFAMLMLFWFAFGHRGGLAGFSLQGKVFWHVQFWLSLFMAVYGTAELSYPGVTRYTLLLIPAFFTMAAVMRRRPLVLAIWLAASIWHYWYVDLCFYAQHGQPAGMKACPAPRDESKT